MKRSEINATIKQFEALLDQYRFRIPPYLSFTPEEWADKNHEWDEIRDNMLGWDITDYGEGDFEHKGLALITLRNGNVKDPKYTKVYAEKIMMSMPGQVSPTHFHWNKMEDIIVRGGGTAVFHLYNADPKTEERLDTPVLVCRDGRRYSNPTEKSRLDLLPSRLCGSRNLICPHFAHILARQHLTHALRQLVQIIIEKVGVHVQRHGRALVPQLPLHGLHVRARSDHETRGRVPQVMDCEVAWYAGTPQADRQPTVIAARITPLAYHHALASRLFE